MTCCLRPLDGSPEDFGRLRCRLPEDGGLPPSPVSSRACCVVGPQEILQRESLPTPALGPKLTHLLPSVCLQGAPSGRPLLTWVSRCPTEKAFSGPDLTHLTFIYLPSSGCQGDEERALEESGFESLLWDVAAVCSGASYVTSLSLRHFTCEAVKIGGPCVAFGGAERDQGCKMPGE